MRVQVLGYPVDAIESSEAIALVQKAVMERLSLHIVTLNAEMTMQGQGDQELSEILKQAQLVLPDGSGVVWAIRRQGKRVSKLAGVDFLGQMAAWCAREGKRVFLFGAAEGVAAEAAEALKHFYPGLQIAGVHSGFFSPEEEPVILETIRSAEPDILWVALGVPRQEKWIARHREGLSVPVMMGVGGSFDVLASRVKRAPAIFRRLHLEWLFRLIQEPWRWRRMAATLPKFAWQVIMTDRRGTA